MINRLNKNKTANIPKFRILVKNGKYESVGLAALSLAELPTAKKDIPLILDALERTRRTSIYPTGQIEEALVKASGLDLPSGTSVEVWREKLKEASLLN